MQYRQAGKWGLQLSCLGLGSFFTIGDTCGEETSARMIRAAYEAGVTFFDTANAYSHGESERIVGKYLKDFRRASYVLLTKVHGNMGDRPTEGGLSAKAVIEQCDASLKRLGMEYVDILMCHRPDPSVPLEETVRAMEDLARRGKIFYWAVSEWPAAMVAQAQAVAREIGARPMVLTEPRYNLLYRYPERDLFPTTRSEGIGNVTFSPLAHGMLSAKYVPGEPPPPGSRGADPVRGTYMKQLYWSDDNRLQAQALEKLARELGVTAARLAIAWILTRSEVTSAILGATSVAQLEENLKAADLVIPPDILAKIEALYPLADSTPRITRHH
jgi:aryl-alcohol dehydrogenase-like predicted oxidoreductase